MFESLSNVAAACTMGTRSAEDDRTQTVTTQGNSGVDLSGIDELLSGAGFSFTIEAPEELNFMTEMEIIQTSDEHTKCKFQGALVYIDKEPRSVTKEPQSPSRKRDAGSCDLLDGLILKKMI